MSLLRLSPGFIFALFCPLLLEKVQDVECSSLSLSSSYPCILYFHISFEYTASSYCHSTSPIVLQTSHKSLSFHTFSSSSSSSTIMSYVVPAIFFSSGILLGAGGATLTRRSLEKRPTTSLQSTEPSLPINNDGKLVDSSTPLHHTSITSQAAPIIGPGGFPGELEMWTIERDGLVYGERERKRIRVFSFRFFSN